MSDKDVIYRQEAIEALRTCYDTETVTYTNGNEYIDYNQALDLLNSLPSAQPEIIRCKDCNHRNRYRFPPQYEERDYCEEHEKVVREDCYCAWAERGQDE